MPLKNSKSVLSRRSLLKVVGLGSALTALYSYYRGIRFPMLSWEPRDLPSQITADSIDITLSDLIHTSHNNPGANFRAYAPEPEIRFRAKQNIKTKVVINNVAPDASLLIDTENQSSVTESIQGITRTVELTLKASQTTTLSWSIQKHQPYSFAAIGDSGGDKELAWCIHRAHELGASFLLHLGDFNYQAGDYDNAIKLFNEAPLPCYVSIGNHDFKESGLIYQQFLDEIGPLNNAFSIGKTRFINLDTAVNFLPFSGGQRGDLIQQLITDTEHYSDNVVFTHRPLHDPQPLHDREVNGDHDIGSDGERDWLIKSLKKLNVTSMLCGHIHIFNRSTYEGIDHIVVGQGLGHQDLMVNDNEISKMAIGNVDQEGKVNYEFAALSMPMELHCHPRVQELKNQLMHLPHAPKIREIDAGCEKHS